MSDNDTKIDIRAVSIEELKDYMTGMDEKPFRAQQIYEWLWMKSARSFDEMTNLSKSFREVLNSKFIINAIETSDRQISSDRTIKNVFRLHDGHLIEGVLIPTRSRITACVSSQVGCSLTCSFCATGKLKRIRNLDPGEIYDQVAILAGQAVEKYDVPLSNIVYMGMGEPLLNYTNMLRSIELITSEQGLGMSPKRITVSTAGIAKMIKKLGDDKIKFNLALSLHAANDDKRSSIMPINEQNSLDALSEALRYFYDATGTRITFEYILFNGFNDTLEDARELASFCKAVPCKINLIEYNPIDDAEFTRSQPEAVDRFSEFLESRNLIVNIRRSRGKDIDAACGQLANKGAETK